MDKEDYKQNGSSKKSNQKGRHNGHWKGGTQVQDAGSPWSFDMREKS